MAQSRALKKLRALLWALTAYAGEVATSNASAAQVKLFYNLESPELRDFMEGMKKAGLTDIIPSNAYEPSICSATESVITFGGDATEDYINTCPDNKVAFVASNFSYTKIKSKLKSGSWGYFNEQPLTKQVEHADRNIPSIKTLGILYKDNDGDLGQIKALAETNSRIQVRLVKIEDGQIVAQVLRSLYEQVDAVLVTSNQEVWPLQDFKTYLLLGMRQGKLMIGGLNQFYTNRGVISAVHNDYSAMGAQMASELGQDHRQEIRYFNKTKITTNKILAARYGIYIGDKPE